MARLSVSTPPTRPSSCRRTWRLTESRATLAYTRYMLETGNRGDILDLHVALAPCIVGYAEIGSWLMDQRFTVRMNNPYGAWLDMYNSREFQQAAQAEVDWLNTQMEDIGTARFHELVRIFQKPPAWKRISGKWG